MAGDHRVVSAADRGGPRRTANERTLTMAIFVLVHGAWGGAHGFRKVRRPLQAAGHEVFTPSLTGIGERAHLTSPQVCLTTHIADVVNAIRYEDLESIVLLGYSYGGVVVTGALEYIGERVRHLVYLDAFVPGDGDSLEHMTGGGVTRRSGTGGPRVPELGADWLVSSPPRDFDDPAEAEWSVARRTPHPAGCFTEPVRLPRPLEDYPFTRTFIKATGDPRPQSGHPFWAAADRAASSPAWRYREIATNHMIPSNRPDELARLLLELA
jgi:pimeloyl-ACP methyl ester carboxylesterase